MLTEAWLPVDSPDDDWATEVQADAEGSPRVYLAVDAMAGVYTDGSCIKGGEGGNKLGAAIWTKRSGMEVLALMEPNGHGPTNTINRAELVALHGALTLAEVACDSDNIVIYTDSLCSIYQIDKALYRPELVLESKHLELLTAIRERCECVQPCVSV